MRALRFATDTSGNSSQIARPATHDAAAGTAGFSSTGAHVIVVAGGAEGVNAKAFRPSTKLLRLWTADGCFFSLTTDNALAIENDDTATSSVIDHYLPPSECIEVAIAEIPGDPPRMPYLRVKGSTKVYISELE